VVVAVGEIACEPEVGSALCEMAGATVKAVAFVVVQVRVTLCPELMLVGLPLKLTVGAGFVGGVGDEETPPHAAKVISSNTAIASDKARGFTADSD
jgi:hypothetical protein